MMRSQRKLHPWPPPLPYEASSDVRVILTLYTALVILHRLRTGEWPTLAGERVV